MSKEYKLKIGDLVSFSYIDNTLKGTIVDIGKPNGRVGWIKVKLKKPIKFDNKTIKYFNEFKRDLTLIKKGNI
jgi:hypothetical protein